MNISESIQNTIDFLFVAGIAIFIVVFWFLIMPYS
jgi:hypothetical protein